MNPFAQCRDRGRCCSGPWFVLFCLGISGLAQAGDEAAPPVLEQAVQRVTLFVQADRDGDVLATRAYGELAQVLAADDHFEFVDFYKFLGQDQKPGGQARKKAEKAYHSGRKAYDNLDLDKAVRLLTRAAGMLEKDVDAPLAKELYTNVMIYLGASQVLTGSPKKGRRVFRRLLSINRRAELNPMVFPPSLVRTFRSVHAGLGAQTGGVEISSTPNGAQVWIDGEQAGLTPLVVDELAEGEHLVHISRRGYHSKTFRLPISAGAQELFSKQLKPLPGVERLLGMLSGLDDEVEGNTRADEIMHWAEVERIFYLRIGQDQGSTTLFGLSAGDSGSSRHHTQTGTIAAGSPAFSKELVSFFSALREGVPEKDPMVGGSEDPDADPVGRDDDEVATPVWKTWWLWTVVGVAVAGGTGLALGLTMGGDSSPSAGEVVFRF